MISEKFWDYISCAEFFTLSFSFFNNSDFWFTTSYTINTSIYRTIYVSEPTYFPETG